jgi:hypothetical protein
MKLYTCISRDDPLDSINIMLNEIVHKKQNKVWKKLIPMWQKYK